MKNTHCIEHALVDHHLIRLRDKNADSETFRRRAKQLATLLLADATRDLPSRPKTIETPMQKTEGREISVRIGLVPILRAGLSLVEPALELMPSAEVWHLGFYRDEETLDPIEYYCKLPESNPVDLAFVLDPMLATGGSAAAAIQAVLDWGVKDCRLLTLISAPEGIQAIETQFPDVKIHTCAIDEKLNDQAYILPGLGDAGDRIYNTQ